MRFNKPKSYALVPNQALKDKRMKMSTRFMWAFICNLPDDWNYSNAGLASAIGCGEKAARTALKELESYGYLIREQCRESNKFAGYNYTLIENPVDDVRSKSRVPTTSLTTQSRVPEKADNKITNRLSINLNKLSNHSSDDEIEKIVENVKERFKIEKFKKEHLIKFLRVANNDSNVVIKAIEKTVASARSQHTPIHNFCAYVITTIRNIMSEADDIEYNADQAAESRRAAIKEKTDKQLKQVRAINYANLEAADDSEFRRYKPDFTQNTQNEAI